VPCAPDATVAVSVRHGEHRAPEVGMHAFVLQVRIGTHCGNEFRLRHESIPIGVEGFEEFPAGKSSSPSLLGN
jgi:hypothetical protein